MPETKSKVYITVYNCPQELQEAARLWKPILNKSINKIYIEMMQRGAEQMQLDVMTRAKERFSI